MATWLDKISSIADKVSKSITETTENVSNTYKNTDLTTIKTKTIEGIQDITGRTQDYFKDISKTNKEIMSEVEAKISENKDASVHPKVASFIAATLNTTQTITDDIVNVSKKVIHNISQDKFDENDKQNHIVYIDSIPLKEVFTKVMMFENISQNLWKNPNQANIYMLTDNDEWVFLNTNVGGKGAISLFSHYLSLLAKKDFNAHKTELEFEAIGILKNVFSDTAEKTNEQNLENPSIKTNKEKSDILNPQGKVAPKAKTPAKKAVKTAKKTTSAKKDTSDTNSPKKATKTVRKRVVKKDDDTKPTKLKP